MAIQTEDLELDVLTRPIPGQSFTDTPGKNPYEQPSLISDPEEAMDKIVTSLEEPSSQESILTLLDTGISSETIASALVLKMFSEGVFTPDVAEIIKPPLTGYITKLGVQAGIEDIEVVNALPQNPMDGIDTMEIMQQLNPAKFERKLNQFEQESQMEELAHNIDFEEDVPPQRESFLDMEVE